jgi:hypothetical protein
MGASIRSILEQDARPSRTGPEKRNAPGCGFRGRFREGLLEGVTAEARDSAAQARDSFLLPPILLVCPELHNLASGCGAW